MRKTFFTHLFFCFLLIGFTITTIAQKKGADITQNKEAKSRMFETWTPIQYNSSGGTIFMDDMNGDNTEAGLNARGWFFDDVDGTGPTTIFQGIVAQFNAYEGPDTGYVAQDFFGAFGGGLVIDQWLISPEVTVAAGDVLQFWHRSPDSSSFPDPLEVHVSSTAGITAEDFDVQLDAFQASITGWAQWTGTFPSAGTVRFAVRYYTIDGGLLGDESNYVGLDLFEVGPPCPIDQATNPDPVDGAIDVDVNIASINWSNGAGADSVEVWFDGVMVYNGTAISTWPITGPLAYSTTYPWQIVGKNDTCSVAGPTWSFTTGNDPNIICIFMDDFNGTTNWSAVVLNDPCDWGYSTTANIPGDWLAPPNFPATADSFYVFASSDFCGVAMDVYLTGTFTIDASLYQTVWIEFDSDMEVFLAPVPADTGAVDVSIDGGATWTRVFERNDDASGEHAFVDLSGLAGLQGDIRFRLCYYGDESWHWALDNFAVYLDDFISNVVQVDVAPVNFALEQNYPNPFNPSTTIKFSLAADSKVTLTVFDILGQEVTNLITTNMTAGVHEVNFNAVSLNSGVYFYRIDATGVDGTNFTSVKKMVLTK